MRLRGKWFMRHPIQAKYLLLVLIAMLAPILLIGFCFYTLVFDLMARQLVFPEAIFGTLVPVIERINGVLALTLPALALVILWCALVISHRFAGPIERIEADLDKILAGDKNHRVRLRKNDDMRGIADRVNALARKLP
jgi:methyl-accepting chemotaxis protein